MITKTTFEAILKQRETLIIDGALATELESRGHDLSHPLWSGKVLLNDPAAIEQVHLDYYLAGADIAITSSYQTSVRGVVEQLHLTEAAANEIIQRSVQLARSARQEAYRQGVPSDRALLVGGSIGPYGAYLADGSEYRGDYAVSSADLKSFHRKRIRALLEAGVDILVLETMPKLEEIIALLELLSEEFPGAIAMLSCTLRDATHISDGTSLEVLFRSINQTSGCVVAFGANCVSPDLITDFLMSARLLTDIPLLAYPNSGETYDGISKAWFGSIAHDDLATRAQHEWRSAGAQLIGGCCRTTPDEIRILANALSRESIAPR